MCCSGCQRFSRLKPGAKVWTAQESLFQAAFVREFLPFWRLGDFLQDLHVPLLRFPGDTRRAKDAAEHEVADVDPERFLQAVRTVLYSADAWPGRIYKLSLDGKVLGVLGQSGKQLKQFGWIHAMACPSENVLYVAELLNWRVQKLILKP